MATVTVQFEHYHARNTLGVQESTPRISWQFQNAPHGFQQHGCEIELTEENPFLQHGSVVTTVRRQSSQSYLIPWPFEKPLKSRQKISVRVRAWGKDRVFTDWSAPAQLETGLLDRGDWACERITAPWAPQTTDGPSHEHLYRKPITIGDSMRSARLYLTSQGIYEAELNGQRVGDYFLAPGWTAYNGRLQYQTYDVTSALRKGANCLGVRVAEGWFCGRIGIFGGHRNIWGPYPALMAQLEVTYADGRVERTFTDSSWNVAKGPIRLAEIYDGEKYDATQELSFWSSVGDETHSSNRSSWTPVLVLPPLPDTVQLTAGFGEPVRRVETVKPREKFSTPSGKTVVDFGQNLVGYVKLKGVQGPRGHKITLSHAEVLEHGEICTWPLRNCDARDEYTLRGAHEGEQYEPRFTFHGFRYAQIDGWPGDLDLASIEAVVCHTDMKSAGSFECSDKLLSQLYHNVRWGMRGNFLSIPTDCPQRDERLGWTGDIALFTPTAVLIYDCFNVLKNWLIDVAYDQDILGGVPPMLSPNATLPDPILLRKVPCAIWHDVTILVPWTLYQETGDVSILAQQYSSMLSWMNVLPRKRSGATHLWDPEPSQLGDWLDPAAPPDEPWKSATDAQLVANMFLLQSLDLMVRISGLLGREHDKEKFVAEAAAARAEFHREYVTESGRMVSDSQAAYALAICFDLLKPAQRARAGARLAELARRNYFKIATGFAGTPFVCEALAATGHVQVAYAMLLEKECPSWLFPVTVGATTVWERWNGMRPDGTINPDQVTSFNHYALGAVAKFMYERVAGLQRLAPGWEKARIAPALGAKFTHAAASHVTPRGGTLSCSWKTVLLGDGLEAMELSVTVPYGTTAEVVLPPGTLMAPEKLDTVGPGTWSFRTTFKRNYEWPVPPLSSRP